MVRKSKYDGAMHTVGVRFPESFTTKCPSNTEISGWIRDLAMNNINDVNVESSGLSQDDKNTIDYFYTFFTKLAKDGVLKPYLSKELIEQATKFKELKNK
jgi:hypothetical protein